MRDAIEHLGAAAMLRAEHVGGAPMLLQVDTRRRGHGRRHFVQLNTTPFWKPVHKHTAIFNPTFHASIRNNFTLLVIFIRSFIYADNDTVTRCNFVCGGNLWKEKSAN